MSCGARGATPESDWLIWQLADSAFPTGGFAHSAGLEAAWQHGEVRDRGELVSFLEAGLHQLGHASLPFVNAAHAEPERLGELDRLCDAFTSNDVANRASRLQGKALLAAAERIFAVDVRQASHLPPGESNTDGRAAWLAHDVAAGVSPAVEPGILPGGNSPHSALTRGGSRESMKRRAPVPGGKMPPSTAAGTAAATLERHRALGGAGKTPALLCAHFAPVFGAMMSRLGVSRDTAARLFFFNHLRGVLAAAVRLNIVGPMKAQALQHRLTPRAAEILAGCEALTLDDIAQTSPLLDVWQGAHDRLYSRLFQS